jgi:hypothetical protein
MITGGKIACAFKRQMHPLILLKKHTMWYVKDKCSSPWFRLQTLFHTTKQFKSEYLHAAKKYFIQNLNHIIYI